MIKQIVTLLDSCDSMLLPVPGRVPSPHEAGVCLGSPPPAVSQVVQAEGTVVVAQVEVHPHADLQDVGALVVS